MWPVLLALPYLTGRTDVVIEMQYVRMLLSPRNQPVADAQTWITVAHVALHEGTSPIAFLVRPQLLTR
jgi:hypothetical protein